MDKDFYPEHQMMSIQSATPKTTTILLLEIKVESFISLMSPAGQIPSSRNTQILALLVFLSRIAALATIINIWLPAPAQIRYTSILPRASPPTAIREPTKTPLEYVGHAQL